MKLLRSFENRSKRPSSLAITYAMASWRSGDAEDCKSLHPGSIPGEASKRFLNLCYLLMRFDASSNSPA
jgi:hypothetical protein